MGVVLPYFLFGLLALGVPIIVHLWSKNTRKSVDFGSIRFLRETETKTMSSIMPSQWLLLFLRLMLLVLLVLLIAEPFVERKMESVDVMYLVDPKYADLPWFQSWKDSLSENEKAFWLSENFPELDEEDLKMKSDYWQLLANPPQVNTKKIIVISPLRLTDFRGKKTSFPLEYEWVKLPINPIEEVNLKYSKDGQAFQVNAISDEWKTERNLHKTDSAEPLQISYFIKTSEEYKGYEELFSVALQTLNELSALTLIKTESEQNADWLFWFSSAAPPQQSNVVSIDSAMVRKWTTIGNNGVLISNDWNIEDAVGQNLPKRLLQLMSPPIDEKQDLRTVDINSFSYRKEGLKPKEWKQENATSLVWILLLIALFAERWASFRSERK